MSVNPLVGVQGNLTKKTVQELVPKGHVGVYRLFSPRGNYIGSTTCFRQRFLQHSRELVSGKHKNWKLKRDHKYFQGNIRFEILEVFSGEDAVYEARRREQDLILFHPDVTMNIDKTVYGKWKRQ